MQIVGSQNSISNFSKSYFPTLFHHGRSILASENQSSASNLSNKESITPLSDIDTIVANFPSYSSARSLLRFSGAWKGDDINQCIEDVYKSRGKTKF